MQVYAHSLPGRSMELWEHLSEHLSAVGRRTAEFAYPLGWAEAGRIAGLLHDIGKCSAEVQAYLGGAGPSRDHSTAGARVADKSYPPHLGRMLAFIIAGHHAGLADGVDLDRRLDPALTELPAFADWERQAGALLPTSALAPTRCLTRSREPGFSESFLIRMLFSCLVDADFLETERFYAEAEGRTVERGGDADMASLRDRLRAYMRSKRAEAEPSRLNALRAEILDHAVGRAGLDPGLFTLTVPTGGGKTLASLSFALEHALAHGLNRIVYVIPFTSIIEQTAAVFREALGPEADVLERHASFDWEAAGKTARDEGRGSDPTDRLRRAAENWDAPIVVTTAVQFFESLFANRTSRCRKLHNLARSVIILDEAQTLPLRLLRPCMAALDELARNYGASIVLCTATQPALREMDEFKGGFRIGNDRELAPDPKRLYAELKRVRVERLGPTDDKAIAECFSERSQMLCIVNSRRHARALFELIRTLPGAVHLTTLMCPRHRRLALAEAQARLRAGHPVRIVSTTLIEAGVDIDLPEVWRASAGVDSIAQAAGRCNREGRLDVGRVVVFEPVESKAPHDLEQAWQAGRAILRKHEDPLTLDAVRDYFAELYWQKGQQALDSVEVDGCTGILPAIAQRAKSFSFPFASIAQAFRVIDEQTEPVIVPWRAGPDDTEAQTILARIAAMNKPFGNDLRRLQQYTVTIPRKARDAWLAQGVLRPAHPALGDALLRFEDLSLYDPKTGLRLDDPGHRSAESNVF